MNRTQNSSSIRFVFLISNVSRFHEKNQFSNKLKNNKYLMIRGNSDDVENFQLTFKDTFKH